MTVRSFIYIMSLAVVFNHSPGKFKDDMKNNMKNFRGNINSLVYFERETLASVCSEYTVSQVFSQKIKAYLALFFTKFSTLKENHIYFTAKLCFLDWANVAYIFRTSKKFLEKYVGNANPETEINFIRTIYLLLIYGGSQHYANF